MQGPATTIIRNDGNSLLGFRIGGDHASQQVRADS